MLKRLKMNHSLSKGKDGRARPVYVCTSVVASTPGSVEVRLSFSLVSSNHLIQGSATEAISVAHKWQRDSWTRWRISQSINRIVKM